MEHSHGPTEENMKETMQMIKRKDRALSTGLMAGNMKVAGKMENSTVMEIIPLQAEK